MFTIILTTHNRPQLLHRALQSLINQTYQNFTAIIVSDSGEYLPPFKDFSQLAGRYVYIQRSDDSGPGPAQSRNLALSLVNTPYVMFLDDDDSFESEHLQNLADWLTRNHAKQTIFYSSFKVQEEDRNVQPPAFIKQTPINLQEVGEQSVYTLNRIPNNALVYPAELLKTLRFDTDMELYEDWDFLLRCMQRYSLQYIDINSVIVHKSYVAGEANLRRGNSQNEKLIAVTLDIYRRFPAPNREVAQIRSEMLRRNGISYQE